jgi:hypothetical protein
VKIPAKPWRCVVCNADIELALLGATDKCSACDRTGASLDALERERQRREAA